MDIPIQTRPGTNIRIFRLYDIFTVYTLLGFAAAGRISRPGLARSFNLTLPGHHHHRNLSLGSFPCLVVSSSLIPLRNCYILLFLSHFTSLQERYTFQWDQPTDPCISKSIIFSCIPRRVWETQTVVSQGILRPVINQIHFHNPI